MRATCVSLTLATLVLSMPSCASTGTLEPLVAGWEHVFKIDWQVAERRGAPVVRGNVVNESPYTVTAVQLLIDSLDASGAIVGQKIVWATPATMSPFMRTSFELAVPGRLSPRYRVRVFAFDRVEVRGGMLHPLDRDDPAICSACSALPDARRRSASVLERISTETEIIRR